jgi:hypothetical protein
MNYVDLLKKTSPTNSIPNENLIVGCLMLNTGFDFIINAFSLKRDEVLTILRNKNQYINENSESYALHFLYNYLDFNLTTEEIKEKYKLSNKFDLNIVNELRVLKEENNQNKVAFENQEDLKPKFEYKEEPKEDPDLIEQTKKELKEEEEKVKEYEEFIDLGEEHLENSKSEYINEIVNDNNNVNVDSDTDTNNNVDAKFNVDINVNNVNDDPNEVVTKGSNGVVYDEPIEDVLTESNEIEYKGSNVFLNADFTKVKDTELYLLCNLYKDKLTELNDLRNKYNDVNDVIKYIKKELKEVLLIADQCGIQLKSELSIVDWDGTYKECLVSNDVDNIRAKFNNMINDISVNNNEIMIWIQIANKTDMLVEVFEKQCKEGLKNTVNNDDEVLNILREYNEKTETE